MPQSCSRCNKPGHNKRTCTVLMERPICPVCYDEIGETNIVTTVCGHTFCGSCMFKNVQMRDSCPLCRTVLCEVPKTLILTEAMFSSLTREEFISHSPQLYIDQFLQEMNVEWGNIPNSVKVRLRTVMFNAIYVHSRNIYVRSGVLN